MNISNSYNPAKPTTIAPVETRRWSGAALNQLVACTLVTAIQVLVPQPVYAADPFCQGNGCEAVSFYWEAGCHRVRNIGSQPVKFTWGLWSGRLKPSESTPILNPFGGCAQGIVGDRSAYLD